MTRRVATWREETLVRRRAAEAGSEHPDLEMGAVAVSPPYRHFPYRAGGGAASAGVADDGTTDDDSADAGSREGDRWEVAPWTGPAAPAWHTPQAGPIVAPLLCRDETPRGVASAAAEGGDTNALYVPPIDDWL